MTDSPAVSRRLKGLPSRGPRARNPMGAAVELTRPPACSPSCSPDLRLTRRRVAACPASCAVSPASGVARPAGGAAPAVDAARACVGQPSASRCGYARAPPGGSSAPGTRRRWSWPPGKGTPLIAPKRRRRAPRTRRRARRGRGAGPGGGGGSRATTSPPRYGARAPCAGGRGAQRLHTQHPCAQGLRCRSVRCSSAHRPGMAPGLGFEPRFEAPQAPVIPSYTIRARVRHPARL